MVEEDFMKIGGFCTSCKQWTFLQDDEDDLGDFEKPAYCASCGDVIDTVEEFALFV